MGADSIAASTWPHAVEVHPPDWVFPAEPSWIAGWIRPQGNRVVVDVRARIDQRVILGLSGLPHPAWAPVAGQPLAGFSFLFAPHPGAVELRLEALDAAGDWTEFFRTDITAAPDAALAPIRPALRESFSPSVIALVRRRLLSPHRSWDRLADELMATKVAEPLNAYPNLPFVGALEEPQAAGRFRYGVVPATGWLTSPASAISRLYAVIDPRPPIDLPYGPSRADIAETFPALADRPGAVIAGEVPLPDQIVEPVLLKVFAELENGEQHLAFAQRFAPEFHRSPGKMPPLISFFTFVRAVRALRGAADRYAVPRQGLKTAAFAFWSAYQKSSAYRPARAYRDNPWQAFPAVSPPAAPAALPPHPAITEIAPADDMLVRDAAPYFAIGREALALVQRACADAGTDQVKAILDLPCGHGRVGRWLRAAYPDARLVASDVQGPGVDFCVKHLGATGRLASVSGDHWASLPGPFDLIWCGSLLTHLDRDQWLVHLRQFARLLSPKGVLVFTSHGLVALDKLQTGEKDYGLEQAAITRLCADTEQTGFGYADYVDSPGYGISVSQPAWIRELVALETPLRLRSIHPSAWDQHQDVVVCTLR